MFTRHIMHTNAWYNNNCSARSVECKSISDNEHYPAEVSDETDKAEGVDKQFQYNLAAFFLKNDSPCITGSNTGNH